MDSLTQVVLGAAVGEVVLGKKIGNKALLFGAIAGTIPDLDVLNGLIQQTISHRGFTHSFFFAFLMSPILGFLMVKIFKDRTHTVSENEFLDSFVKRFFRESNATFKEWTILYFWGFITHILLDVQTIYGTELLWPIKSRLAIGNVFVADPLYTLPFLICVIAVSFYKRNTFKRKFINILGITISSLYLMLTMVFKGITYKKFTKNLEQQNVEYLRIETGPTPLNSILWYANVETKDQYLMGHYSLLDKDDEIKFSRFDKNPKLRSRFENYEKFQALNHFSKDWYILREDSNVVSYYNIRFGSLDLTNEKPQFMFRYILEEENSTLEFKESFARSEKKTNFKQIFSRLYYRMLGNK